jgi:hypothetical protein
VDRQTTDERLQTRNGGTVTGARVDTWISYLEVVMGSSWGKWGKCEMIYNGRRRNMAWGGKLEEAQKKRMAGKKTLVLQRGYSRVRSV